jgi:hypothetical protein
MDPEGSLQFSQEPPLYFIPRQTEIVMTDSDKLSVMRGAKLYRSL